MARLLEAGITVLLLSTVAVPAQSQDASSLQNQPTQAIQSTHERPTAKPAPTRLEAVKPNAPTEIQPPSKTVAERDRVQLEHYLQRTLPVGVTNDQISGF